MVDDAARLGGRLTSIEHAPATPSPVRVVAGHRAAPSAFCRHPDGRWVTGGGHDDAVVRLWRVDGSCEREIATPHHGGIRSLAIDARRGLAFTSGTSGDARIFAWDLGTGDPVRELQVAATDFAAVVFDPTADMLVVVDGALHGWPMGGDAAAPGWSVQEPADRTGAYVRVVVDSATGRIWALRIHDGPRGQLEVRRIADGGLESTVALDYDFSPFRGFADGELVDAGAGRILWVSQRARAPSALFDRDTGRRLATLATGAGTRCGAVVRSDVGEAIAIGSGRGELTVWRLPDAQAAGSWMAHDGEVTIAATIDDGRMLVTGGADGRVVAWDVASAIEHARHGAAPTDVGVIDARADGPAELVGATVTGQLVRYLPSAGLVSAFAGTPVETGRIALAGERSWAAATVRDNYGSPARVRVVDLDTAAIVAEPPEPIDWASELAWLRNGQLAVLEPGAREGRIVTIGHAAARPFAAPTPERGIKWLFVSGARDVFACVEPERGNEPVAVHLYDAEGRHLHALAGHRGAVHDVVFTADGRQLVTAGTDTTLRLWDVATGACLRVLGKPASPFASSARVPAARVALVEALGLAVSTRDRKPLRVWNLATGECIGELEGHKAPPTWIAAPRRGEWAASAGPDGSVRTWDLRTCVQSCMVSFDAAVDRLRVVGDDVLAVVTKGPRLHLLQVGAGDQQP